MGLTLDIGYLIAAILASPWLLYRAVFRGDRQGLARRFGFRLGGGLDQAIWLHGASAGEISLLGPFVSLLERDMPGTPLVISAYSSTGYAAARHAFPGHRVVFFPFDLSFVVSRFISRFNPRLIVIVESDFWPNFLSAAQRREIPVAVINGKMSAKSCERYAATFLIPPLLRRISLLAVQSQEHAQRLCGLGVPRYRVRVTGNMKYDLARPEASPDEAQKSRLSLGYDNEDVVIIGGSVHEPENEALLDAFVAIRSRGHRCALIVVPRYPRDATRVVHAAQARGLKPILKTATDRSERDGPGSQGVLVVDTVGELRRLYGVADIAFVGGSLFYRGSNRGGHNLMEPAVLGLPVLFGPYHFSFREIARELLENRAGFEVAGRAELEAALSSLVSDPEYRREVGSRARDVVLRGQGATQRNYELLEPLLGAAGQRLPALGFDRTMPPAVGDTDSS